MDLYPPVSYYTSMHIMCTVLKEDEILLNMFINLLNENFSDYI